MPKFKKAVVRRQESEFRIKDTAETLRAQRNSTKILGTLPYFQRRQRLLSLVKELAARFWMLDTRCYMIVADKLNSGLQHLDFFYSDLAF